MRGWAGVLEGFVWSPLASLPLNRRYLFGEYYLFVDELCLLGLIGWGDAPG